MSEMKVVEHYRQRGTFEDRLGEFNRVLGPHLSQEVFEKNEINLLMALLAFSLSSFLRLELAKASGGSWDLTRFREFVLKAGGRVTKHGNRLVVKLSRAIKDSWYHLSSRLARWVFPESVPPPAGPEKRTWMPPPHHAHLELIFRQ